MNSNNVGTSDYRRNVVLIAAIGLLSVSAWLLWQGETTGSAKMVGSATGRIGLVLGALWLAWPTLRKPARWLPPGFAVLGVAVLALLAAQPRLIVVMVPAFSGLLVFASILRAMRH